MKLQELPIGAKVRETETKRIFLVAAQNQPGYKGTILWSDRIVRKGCFDGAEQGDQKYGWNNYALSNVHQWLNSDRQEWFRPSHASDTPPSAGNSTIPANAYDGEPGYLYAYPKPFRDALVENEIPYVRKTEGENVLATVSAKVFLLSADELGLRRFTSIQEGCQMPLFRDFRMRLGFKKADPADFNFPGEVSENNQDMGWYYWLRTPHHVYPFLTAHVHFSGYISYDKACNSDLGILPALALRGDVAVSEQPDADQVYDLMLGGEGK